MTLVDNIGALATRVATEFNAIRSALPVDVSRYGAVGNNTTDDTAALQAAIAAVPASGGVLRLARNATYKISSALTVKSGLVIDGNGSTIRQATTSAHGLVGLDVVGLTIRDLTLTGPNSGSGTGIRLTRSTRNDTPKLLFSQLVVLTFGADGIDLSNPITSTFQNVECRANLGHGFNIHGVSGGSAGTSCSFVSCYANGNTKAGYHVDTMAYCAFVGCAADANGRQYELINCQGFSLSGCGSEEPENRTTGYVGDAFYLSGCYGVTLDGCWTYQTRTTSLWITGASQAITVTGFTENSPLVGATNCVKVDTGSTATLVHISNTNALSLAAGTTLTVNDGGGLSMPGYLYGGSTAYFEGEVSGAGNDNPSWDGAFTSRGWVNTQLAGKADALPAVVQLATIATGNIVIDASLGSLYRITVTGASCTVVPPAVANAVDSDVVNLEILCSAACTITFGTGTAPATILLTGATPSTITAQAGKRVFTTMRYVTGVGWFLLGAALQA